MSVAKFVEAFSGGSYVRDLHRRVVQILNDPALDRKEHELQVRKIQSTLCSHLETASGKEKRLAEKNAGRSKSLGIQRQHGVAHPSQVMGCLSGKAGQACCCAPRQENPDRRQERWSGNLPPGCGQRTHLGELAGRSSRGRARCVRRARPHPARAAALRPSLVNQGIGRKQGAQLGAGSQSQQVFDRARWAGCAPGGVRWVGHFSLTWIAN